MKATRLLVACGALLLPLLGLQLFAPLYLFHLGFPLDDAWIHAVYGRSLAQSGVLAYNPGIPANGETSLLWAVMLAIPHLVASQANGAVIGIKLLGLCLHAITVLLAFQLAVRLRASRPIAVAAAGLVALHPDLVAASVSGMEVPLATSIALWMMLEVLRGPSWRLALACALAPWARPETACLGFAFIACRAIAGTRRQTTRAFATALAGTTVSFALMAWRNFAITGRPLPATFYAKVGTSGIPRLVRQWIGYHDLLGHFALVDTLIVLIPLTVLALVLLLQPRWRLLSRLADADAVDASTAAALFFTGLAFFTVSFDLVPPFDHASFYFQRYALPALPLVLVAIPLLLDRLLRALPLPSSRLQLAQAAMIAACGVAVLIAMPDRLRSLENAARNIDDVQVAEGKALRDLPASAIVWAVDAGAIRYFGNAFVVDAVGLNSPDMLGPDAQRFLLAHPPTYISFVGGWTRFDEASGARMQGIAFQPSTPYTVTSFPGQAMHYLTRCPMTLSGRYMILTRAFAFNCASS
jgi:hypothetical protein